MSASGGPSSRVREWYGRLGRVPKALAALATLVITIGGVASGVTAVLDLGGRLGTASPVSSGALAPTRGRRSR
jgi:hypothetical protein